MALSLPGSHLYVGELFQISSFLHTCGKISIYGFDLHETLYKNCKSHGQGVQILGWDN